MTRDRRLTPGDLSTLDVTLDALLDVLRAGDYLTCPGCRTINPLDELDPATPVCAECGRCL